MNVRNPDITGPCHHLKTGARIRAQHEHIKNVTTHPALTGEGGKSFIVLLLLAKAKGWFNVNPSIPVALVVAVPLLGTP
jgi:hypothetical protein